MKKYKNMIPFVSALIYILTAVTAVTAAWSSGKHLYDLSPSFSLYVGMHRWTSVLYFIVALIILPMLTYYTAVTKLPVVKRIVYAAAFIFIFGTAVFPCNTYSDAPTPVTQDLHNIFAIGGMLPVIISFVLTVILSKHRIQRIVAALSLVYAAAFAVMFLTGFMPLFRTFFIWENLFIILLLLGLHMEEYGEQP